MSDIKRLKEEAGYDIEDESSRSQENDIPIKADLCEGLTSEEYEEMYARIRAELTEELKKEDDQEKSKIE